MSTAASGTKFKVTDMLFLVMLAIALFVAIAKPWVPELPPQGHLVLFALIVTIGLWIFKPCSIPQSVAGMFFLLFTLALKIKVTSSFLYKITSLKTLFQ
jgi:hypothetical protein